MNNKKKRVAAYIYTSMDEGGTGENIQMQVDYYTNMIAEKPDWEFAGIYADEAVNGVTPKEERREGYDNLMKDAFGGKIDIIIVRTVSRFGRNVSKVITKIRKLKAAGVEIFFELDNLWTSDPVCDMIFQLSQEMLSRGWLRKK